MSNPSKSIRDALQAEETALRSAHRWLNRQDLIGAFLFLTSIAACIGVGTLYYQGFIPAWTCLLANAFFLSIGHEIEHDLIHRLYFSRHKWLRDSMLLLGWLTRPTSINPWIRMRLHHHHHRNSGQLDDAEERLIGNGIPYNNLARWLVMAGPWFAFLQLRSLRRHGSPFRTLVLVLSPFPMVFGATVFVVYWLLLSLFGPGISQWAYDRMPLWNALMVGLIGPNLLRMFCLQFVSSTIHYFGDVRELRDQTQVFNAWYWLPFQAFCFNFGATHALHHFLPSQPFYIRQWLAQRIYPVMKTQGVRFNDIGTFRRNNRHGA
ncbi:MAG TPA: fatty acid desaturase [bacterium]|nr:fatty acid desaturase [bacterium]